jgi:hypothetical protein
MCAPRRLHPPVDFVAQPTNRDPFGFDVQTKKPSRWFWGPNHQTVAVGFEAQTRKPSTTGIKAKLGETITTGFEAKLEKTVTTGFVAKPEKTVATDFAAKLEKTIATSFEVKPEKTVPVVLRPNYWQTVDLGFEAQPKYPWSSSPRAWCRSHIASPDLLIVWPPNTRLVRPSPVLCTRSPTPAMILIHVRHVTPSTCTPRDKQTRFFK